MTFHPTIDAAANAAATAASPAEMLIVFGLALVVNAACASYLSRHLFP